jgi:serine/threonine protein kinase
VLTWQKYDVEVDIWSAGCIFAEMLEGSLLRVLSYALPSPSLNGHIFQSIISQIQPRIYGLHHQECGSMYSMPFLDVSTLPIYLRLRQMMLSAPSVRRLGTHGCGIPEKRRTARDTAK